MTPTSKSSAAASGAATETSGRQFDMPIEFPANMRDLARHAVAQTRAEQTEIAANELVSTLVSTQSTAARGIANYRAWLMKVAHRSMASAFDFTQNLATAKSLPDVIECTRTHGRVQLEALALQTNELTELGCNVATEMAESIKTSIATAREA